jgi:hypothetical protein
MTRKVKYLFLTIATLLLAACYREPDSTPTAAATEIVSEVECTIPITINDVINPSPGDRVYLSPDLENSFGWTFNWQSEPPILIETDQFSASLIVPNGIPQISVTLEAVDDEGCVGSGSLLIHVSGSIVAAVEAGSVVEAPPPTATATAAATAAGTAVPTDTPSPIPDPTLTATATSVPSETPPPTAARQPTAVPISNPVITNVDYLPGGAVIIAWHWDGQLSPTQNFAVRFWSENDPRPEARFSITWTKENRHEFSVNNVDFPIGTYLINVAVMEGPSDGIHTELVRSEDRHLFVDPPPPTTTPPPLP